MSKNTPATKKQEDATQDRGIVSESERRTPVGRAGMSVLNIIIFAFLALGSLFPLIWLTKAAISTSNDTLRDPLAWWPSGIQWDNIARAWKLIDIGGATLNTVWIALGTWFFTVVVALTAGYVISVLRPKYAKLLMAGVMLMLFTPGVVLLVPLYLTVLSVPGLQVNLLNTFWAVWLPSAANAFIVLLVKSFFDGLPRELFEAARVDGANTFQVFWSIVLPMSRPVIAVVSLLTIMGAWKEFLWPLLVLPSPKLFPLSVVLADVAERVDTGTLIAGMTLSIIVPLVAFIVFHKQLIRSAGHMGGVKG